MDETISKQQFFRQQQERFDAAHARAYALSTSDALEAQRQFEDAEINIEAFEAALTAAEEKG